MPKFIHSQKLPSLLKLCITRDFGLCYKLCYDYLFCILRKVDWWVAFIMIFGSLIGGWIGGKLAGKMKPEILRWIVVTAGLIAAVAFFVKG